MGSGKLLRRLFRESLAGHFWREYQLARVLREFEKVDEIEIHGLKLDVKGIPAELKKRIQEGGYEEAEIDCCRRYLKADDRVLEIGAAIGYVGLYCRKVLGIQSVMSVEANPETLKRLERNYQLNGLTAEARNLALAEADGMADFFCGEYFWSDSLRIDSGSKVVKVNTARFETIYGAIAPEPTALVVDVEGGEKALAGTKFPKALRTIICEMHPDQLGMKTVCDIINAWVGQGFALRDVASQAHVFQKA